MIEQIFIAILGVGAVWLSQDELESRQRWACILGLAAQPFWLISAVKAGQWGIVGLVFLYGYGWWRGIKKHWLKRPQTP